MFTRTGTRMFPTALFIIAKTGNYQKGPLPIEWVNKWWPHLMEQSEDEQSLMPQYG